MAKFPLKFEVSGNATSGIAANWTSVAGSLPPIPCAIPPEFMGPGGGYSPEDLFALSVLNCLIALYKVYCEKSNVRFSEISVKAILFMDRQDGSLVMSQIDFDLDVKGASDPEKARQLLDAAIRDCPVGNSIKSGKTFKVSIA
jgi:uncharacterized OsmC-like protein